MVNRKALIAVVAVLVMSISFSGCESLRKKFTRQKKKNALADDANFVPILEPMDYPAPEHDPQAMYKEHYYLVKAWYKDLWSGIEEKTGEKHILYIIKQVNSHLDEMAKLVPAEKQMQLNKLKEDLKYYRESLDAPQMARNISRIQSDLRSFHRRLVEQLTPGKLDWKN